jgi:hypothetical protein
LSHKLWTLLIQKLKRGFEGCCASALSLYNASKMGLCLFNFLLLNSSTVHASMENGTLRKGSPYLTKRKKGASKQYYI